MFFHKNHLSGLGAGSSCPGSPLSVQSVYDLARNAGFDADHARTMVAIAQRESSLNPSCLATSVAGSTEASYGLWQINMYGPLGAQRLAQFGITDPTQLLDPATNARAAYALWGGNDANLNTAWMINTNTATIPYATLYQNNLNNLPSNLESTYGGSDSGSNSASSSSDTSVGNILDSASAGDLTSIGVLAGAGFALLYLLFGR